MVATVLAKAKYCLVGWSSRVMRSSINPYSCSSILSIRDSQTYRPLASLP